ncbi:hypothetical protein GUJ93_ZPchr0004g39460 [Zizania palustris]|uniref:Uncharacterized protein n=1 Tax=Zizania palustris TaxID=103762 RepID=A0A8J5VZ95_ZIZPA|nr:hypothetical protein GUJ93_ZPchr0004g39460 [Zizania palustris]
MVVVGSSTSSPSNQSYLINTLKDRVIQFLHQVVSELSLLAYLELHRFDYSLYNKVFAKASIHLISVVFVVKSVYNTFMLTLGYTRRYDIVRLNIDIFIDT